MKITVVGLGLIGGSMALDLKARGYCKKVIGVDLNPEHCRKALELKIADEIKPLEKALNADIVILAIPVTAMVKTLPYIMNRVGRKTIVMDVGSTKQKICNSIKNHPHRGRFVATHPIAGTENSGPGAAVQNLFDNKICILSAEHSAAHAVERISFLYKALNMKLLFMRAGEHDKHVAYVSHISHISSFALATTVLEMEQNTSTIFDLAGSGFESTVRLAKSSPEMWAPIFEQNAKYISQALSTYIRHLSQFKKQIDKKNTKATLEMMQKANVIRRVLRKNN